MSLLYNLRYLRANTKRAFPWFLLRRGSFFRLKGFRPFLDIYLHIFAADQGRPFFFCCLLIFLVEFPLLQFCFFYNFLYGSIKDRWLTTFGLVVKLL